MTLAAKDNGLMIGAVIVGGCVEGFLGLSAKYWRRLSARLSRHVS